jgi:predicted O-methyltransferase YrrM
MSPAGTLITLEANPKHAEVARANIARAGLSDVVKLRLGPAIDTLAQLAAEHRAPFDLIFIDADKENYPAYLAASLK